MFVLRSRKFLTLVLVCLLASCPTCGAAASKRRSKQTVIEFQGVGSKDGKIDSALYSENVKGGTIEEEKQSSIELPSGVQKVVDGAGKTLKHIDSATLDTVNNSLKFLNVEAESAKIRPMDGGIGLGISIKLDKGKKLPEAEDGKSKEKSKEEANKEVYGLILPSDKKPQ